MSNKKTSPKDKQLLDKLDKMQLSLIETLAERIKSPDVDAATLNVARQMLKDAGIQVSHSGLDRKALEDLNSKVPFPVPDR